MDKLMKKFFRSSLITSLFLIALGILLIFQSEVTIITIAYVVGSVIIALGVLSGIKFFSNLSKEKKSELDLVYGIISVVLGIVIIDNPEGVASIMPIILGVSIIISSATKLQYAFELKANNNNLWKTTMLLSIISTICGLVLLFNPFKAISYFTKLVGVFIIIYAVLDMISTYTIKRNVKIFQKSIEESITEAVVVEEEILENAEDKEKKTKNKKTKTSRKKKNSEE
ncbi:MAG: DUF308 domain-containing protein [Mycoplasmatota bacterium]|nr:DUF308 domain-containing protein [Mycoplasmatota bacterium]